MQGSPWQWQVCISILAHCFLDLPPHGFVGTANETPTYVQPQETHSYLQLNIYATSPQFSDDHFPKQFIRHIQEPCIFKKKRRGTLKKGLYKVFNLLSNILKGTKGHKVHGVMGHIHTFQVLTLTPQSTVFGIVQVWALFN